MKYKNYFKYSEFIKSDTAARNNINNDVPKSLLDALYRTWYGMNQVRSLLGVPVVITSGYRCKALNDIVSTTTNSQHMKMEAIDFQTPKLNLREAYNKIAKSDIEFDQLILEKNSKGVEWIHISFAEKNRRSYFELKV